MNDIDELLRGFDPGLASPPPAAADLRSRGDRMRRRRRGVAVALAAAVVAAVAVPFALAGHGRDATPVGPGPSVTPSPTVVTRPGRVPDNFPLAAGWPAAGGTGEDARVVSAPSRTRPPLSAEACGRTVAAVGGIRDRVNTTFDSISSHRGREVRIYRSEVAAARAMQSLRAVFAECPSEHTDVPTPYLTTVRRWAVTGFAAWEAIRDYGANGYPGLDIFQVVRDGRALLIQTFSDEGGGADTVAAAVSRSARRPLAALARLRE